MAKSLAPPKRRLPAALLLFLLGCPNSTSTPDSGSSRPAPSWVAPVAGYREDSPFTLPAGAGAISALAVQESTGFLFVSAGAKLYRGLATDAGGTLQLVADLTSLGIASVSSFSVGNSDDLVVFDGQQVVRAKLPLLSLVSRVRSPLSSNISVAISPDARRAYAVEGGQGSAGKSGSPVVHVATLDLDAGTVSEVWELTPPFSVVSATLGAINAGAAAVSSDGATLYLTHVILRQLYRVALSSGHLVSAVDTQSVQRSALTMALGSDALWVQAATFDQTVPIFTASDETHWRFLVEIPVGLSPQGVASYRRRVLVAMASGSAFPGPPPGDGGFPNFADGGFPPPADAGPPSPSVPNQIRIFPIPAQ